MWRWAASRCAAHARQGARAEERGSRVFHVICVGEHWTKFGAYPEGYHCARGSV